MTSALRPRSLRLGGGALSDSGSGQIFVSRSMVGLQQPFRSAGSVFHTQFRPRPFALKFGTRCVAYQGTTLDFFQGQRCAATSPTAPSVLSDNAARPCLLKACPDQIGRAHV